MDQVQVEITGLAITSRYGTLTTGTLLNTDAAYAKHLVEDAVCAKYTSVKRAAPVPAPAPAPLRAAKVKPKAPAAVPSESAADAGDQQAGTGDTGDALDASKEPGEADSGQA